jgi:flagellar basal-body rod modification protein FlgD
MDVNPVSSTTTASTSAAQSASKKAALDYDTFLTLLVQQMKNQDPTEPMDATDQIAQLATFSQVEQTIQTNKNLENLLLSSTLNQAGTIVGRTLTSADGTISGKINEVKVFSDGLIAILDSGKEVVVTAGVKIS